MTVAASGLIQGVKQFQCWHWGNIARLEKALSQSDSRTRKNSYLNQYIDKVKCPQLLCKNKQTTIKIQILKGHKKPGLIFLCISYSFLLIWGIKKEEEE